MINPKAQLTAKNSSRLFENISRGSGWLIVVVLAAVAAFLIIQAWPTFTASSSQISAQAAWFKQGTNLFSFIGPLLWGTILVSIVALFISVPISVGVALFITMYAPRRLAQILSYAIDLLAAIPSVVYGLWGVMWMLPKVSPVFSFLTNKLGFLPFFEGPAANPPRTILSAGLVLAVMVIPIVTSISREAFVQTPASQREGALALGATHWEMIRLTVIPFGKSGIVGASMLALGRALGETMAVVMILSPGLTYSLSLLQAGKQNTIAANIASQFPESSGLGVSTLIATGLALFTLALLVNLLTRRITSRLGVKA